MRYSPKCLRFLNKCFPHKTQVKNIEPAVLTKIAGFPVGKLSIGGAEQPLVKQYKVSNIESAVCIYISADCF